MRAASIRRQHALINTSTYTDAACSVARRPVHARPFSPSLAIIQDRQSNMRRVVPRRVKPIGARAWHQQLASVKPEVRCGVLLGT